MTAFVDLQFDITHLPALVVVGLAVFFGTIGARLFQRLRIPQVVGYIVIGLVVGETGLKLITAETASAPQSTLWRPSKLARAAQMMPEIGLAHIISALAVWW